MAGTRSNEIYSDLFSYIGSDSENDEISNHSDRGSESDICTKPVQRVFLQNSFNGDSSDDDNSDVESECTISDFTSKLPDFLGQPGLKTVSVDLTNIKSCFELIMGDDFIDIFVKETNRYYYQNNPNNNVNRDKEWTDTNIIEMKKFIGLLILMRLVRRIEINDYWSTNPLVEISTFGNAMTEERF